jgi:copper(I)-binding protein
MQKELAAGDKISLTLTFEKAGPMTIEAEVKEGEMMGHMEHDGTEEPTAEHGEHDHGSEQK